MQKSERLATMQKQWPEETFGDSMVALEMADVYKIANSADGPYSEEATMAEVYKVVYRQFKRAGGGGADGHVVGLNGSINPRCVEIVLTWMEVNGKAVLDFGCASGMFLVCCSLAGAARGIGVELPDNKGQQYIFDAACKQIKQALSVHLHDLEWNAQDINQVLEN